jgi:TetR/AcrR family transcriptional regulator, regulator of autoinduction and epiphytic fitness
MVQVLQRPAPAASAPQPLARPSFKQQMLQAREEAIVQTVNRLLAEKGFDLMTVDEVAAEVGIAKASLYKHFPSKEDLATAAMVRAMARAHLFLDTLPETLSALDKLREIVRWCLQLQLRGEMPTLPSENSSLRATLMGSKAYVNSLVNLSDRIGAWIEAAQANGSINPKLPGVLVLYTLYARACDPVPGFLRSGGLFGDEQIVEMVLGTCFDGLK